MTSLSSSEVWIFAVRRFHCERQLLGHRGQNAGAIVGAQEGHRVPSPEPKRSCTAGPKPGARSWRAEWTAACDVSVSWKYTFGICRSNQRDDLLGGFLEAGHQ
jgi:hypothetical protein